MWVVVIVVIKVVMIKIIKVVVVVVVKVGDVESKSRSLRWILPKCFLMSEERVNSRWILHL